MTQKTRGHDGLFFCMAFSIIGGMAYVAGGGISALAALGAPPEMSINHIAGAMLSFSLALACFALAGLIRLAVHVADDLYMLRLIAVNAYSRLPQLPKP